jgi:glycerophosphoryl diester phosphodiesterase
VVNQSFERVGHRGAPRVFPANTLRSFQAAYDLGCTMVECDVRLSRDGDLLLAHDAEVRNLIGAERVITEHTREELIAFDLGAGEGPATLEQLVDWVKSTGMNLMVDMKCEGGPETSPVEQRIADLLSDIPRERKCVSGASRVSRLHFRKADPNLPLLLSVSRNDTLPSTDEFLNNIFATWEELDVDGASWQHPLITVERVETIHCKGGRVFAWTVDDLETMRRVRDCGVDGITSNRSDLFAELSVITPL